MSMEEIMTKVIAQYGALGVLIWLVFHVFKSLIPEALGKISTELDAQRREFSAVLKEYGELLRQLAQVIQRLEKRLEHDNRQES